MVARRISTIGRGLCARYVIGVKGYRQGRPALAVKAAARLLLEIRYYLEKS